MLKASIDELITMVQDKRADLLEGVEVYKSKRFKIIRGLLEQERDKLFEDMKVSENYRFLDIEVLVVEGSFGKSKLSKKAIESLESMVRRIKALEDAVTIRTLQLKVTCIDAGLQFPIELNEVEAFIKEDDYDERLTLMIESRLKVEKQVKERAEKEAEEKRRAFEREEQRKKDDAERIEAQKIADAEREEQRKIDEENQRIEREKAEEQRKKDEVLRQQQESGSKKVMIQASFEVEVPLKITDEQVLNKFKKQLEEMFTTTLKGVEFI